MFADGSNPRAPHISFNVYVYNTTNPKEALNGAQPIVQELGPYVYHEIVHRLNISFGADALGAQTISFKPWPYFLFDRARTPSHLDPRRDIITTMNMPFQLLSSMGLAFVYANRNDSYRLFTTRSVHEIMWCVLHFAPSFFIRSLLCVGATEIPNWPRCIQSCPLSLTCSPVSAAIKHTQRT